MARERSRRGAGSAYPVAGGWMVAFPSGPMVNGRRKRPAHRFPDEDSARAELERLRRINGIGGVPADGTLGGYLDAWLADVRSTVSEATWTSYSGHVAHHIAPLLGGIPVARLRPHDVARLKADRLAAMSLRGKTDETRRPLSPATVARILTTLRIALGAAVSQGSLTANVAAMVKPPRAREHAVEAMTDADADQLVAAFGPHGDEPAHWLWPLVRMLAGSGLRLGEALSLNQGDALEAERFVRIRKSKTTVRAVPITADAAEAIRAARLAAPRVGPREPLFFAPRKTRGGQRDRLSGYSASHAIPRVLEAAGLPRTTAHGFRHGMATRLVSRGVNIRVVAGQLGHASPSLTLKTYAHVVPQVQADAVAMLDTPAKGGRTG